jgi:hypothetical protein
MVEAYPTVAVTLLTAWRYCSVPSERGWTFFLPVVVAAPALLLCASRLPLGAEDGGKGGFDMLVPRGVDVAVGVVSPSSSSVTTGIGVSVVALIPELIKAPNAAP